VFNLLVDGNIARAVRGEKIGTLVVTGDPHLHRRVRPATAIDATGDRP
jgi:hypothetical protein